MHIEQVAALKCWKGDAEIEPLAGGITNRNYIVRDGTNRFVVRVCEERRFLGIDRENERRCQTAAHRAGVSPEIMHAENGMLVIRYIAGETLEGRKIDDALSGRLAELLKQLHASRNALTGEMLFFCPLQTVRTYVATARAAAAELPEDMDDILLQMNRLAEQLEPFHPTLCHNDLLPANIIDDGRRLWLIDWEYSGIGNPLFDIAGLAANCDFNRDQVSELLTHWNGNADPGLMRQIEIQKTVSFLREALWAVIQSLHSAINYDYHAYARNNFAGFRRSLTSVSSFNE